jgi:molybdopterin synthase sulfur carrier subunit
MSMAVVTLRSPLRQLAADNGRVEVSGSTLGEVLADLLRRHPRLTGWVLDERGEIREHVNVFVNGERGTLQAPVRDRDRVAIIQNISGGSE